MYLVEMAEDLIQVTQSRLSIHSHIQVQASFLCYTHIHTLVSSKAGDGRHRITKMELQRNVKLLPPKKQAH